MKKIAEYLDYKVRFIKKEDVPELMNMYHLSKVPFGNDKHKRMVYTVDHFQKKHPEYKSTGIYKDLDGLLHF